MTAAVRREQIEFATRTAEALGRLGARRVEDPYDNGPDALVISMGAFEIDTRAGRLRVTAYGDSITTRFDDAEAGRRWVGATAPSGKWNFHGFDVGLDHGQADREGRVLSLFLCRLVPVLPEPPGAAAS